MKPEPGVMKATLLIATRLLALTVVYFVCFAGVSAALIPSLPEQPAPAQAGAAIVPLLAVSLLNTIVLSYVILRSRWSGWKLVLAIFFVLYGVTTVMPQIETAFFVTRLPPGMLPRLFLSGAVIGALVSSLAVLILGKGRSNERVSNRYRLDMHVSEWVGKLSLIVIIYLIIYFSFGYFIAWKSAAVRAYYGGSDPGSFLSQMSTVLRGTPMLLPLQAARALLWTFIAVPVIRMMKGQWWETGLAVSLLFAVVMCSQLLLPNPLMPQEVRMVHLLETATSNFLFGWLIVLVLNWRRAVPQRSVPGNHSRV